MTNETIWALLEQLNWNYGRGDIITVQIKAGGKGRFKRKPYGMTAEWRPFEWRVTKRGVVVKALGHQRTG